MLGGQTPHVLFEIATNLFRRTNQIEIILLSGLSDRTVCLPKLQTPLPPDGVQVDASLVWVSPGSRIHFIFLIC